MNITTSNPTAFCATRVPAALPLESNYRTYGVRKLIEGTKLYEEAAKKKFDIYFLQPTRKNEIMRVVYFDNNMGTFVRRADGRFLEVSASSTKQPNARKHNSIAERILKALYKVVHGEYKAPNWYTNPGKYIDEQETICRKNGIQLQ